MNNGKTFGLAIAALVVALSAQDVTEDDLDFEMNEPVLPPTGPNNRNSVQGFAAKYVNLSTKKMGLYWDDNKEGKIMAKLSPGEEVSFQSYANNKFFWARAKDKKRKRLKSFTLDFYRPINAFIDKTTKENQLRRLRDELDFLRSYRQRTNRNWIATYPRPEVSLPMREAEKVGAVTRISSTAVYWDCRPNDRITDPNDCKGAKRLLSIPLDLRVVAMEPRLFVVDNFLSDYECDHLIRLGKKELKRSTVGTSGREDKTRTSSGAWITRDKDAVTTQIFKRLGHVFNLKDEFMIHTRNAESLNIIRYKKDQKYDPHYDWSANGKQEARFISAQMFLKTPTEGGQSEFPLAKKGEGLLLSATKGTLAFFYTLLPDGNIDEYGLHGSGPVTQGIKWEAQMWVWDPHKEDAILDYDPTSGTQTFKAKSAEEFANIMGRLSGTGRPSDHDEL